jgi:hypothetical protein
VKVDLPRLGLTDVLLFPGEVVLGDVCIAGRRSGGRSRATAAKP